MAVEERTRGKRLPPEIFDLPAERMAEGYYTDAYFNHTRATLLADGRHPRVLMQVFQRKHAMLGGVDEAIAILKLCSGDWDALTVHALYDGDRLVRRQYGAGRDEVRGAGAGGHEHHRPRRFRERLAHDGAGGCTRPRSATLGSPAGHVGPARRSLALERDGGFRPARRQRTAR